MAVAIVEIIQKSLMGLNTGNLTKLLRMSNYSRNKNLMRGNPVAMEIRDCYFRTLAIPFII